MLFFILGFCHPICAIRRWSLQSCVLTGSTVNHLFICIIFAKSKVMKSQGQLAYKEPATIFLQHLCSPLNRVSDSRLRRCPPLRICNFQHRLNSSRESFEECDAFSFQKKGKESSTCHGSLQNGERTDISSNRFNSNHQQANQD